MIGTPSYRAEAPHGDMFFTILFSSHGATIGIYELLIRCWNAVRSSLIIDSQNTIACNSYTGSLAGVDSHLDTPRINTAPPRQ